MLEQENKELKELNKKICEDWEKEIKVYWNVLEEIREIANAIVNGKHITNDIEGHLKELSKQIIEKKQRGVRITYNSLYVIRKQLECSTISA